VRRLPEPAHGGGNAQSPAVPTAALDASPAHAAAYAVGLYLIAWATAALLLRRAAIARAVESAVGRHASIDGLRGVLATAVFVCHSVAAHGWFVRGRWQWSGNAVLDHCGQTAVAMFFMITGFLFTQKAGAASIDWLALYRSRAARLWPLYALVVCVVFALALAHTGFTPREPLPVLLRQFLQWLAFVCFGRPDVNGIALTWTMIAGVNWSLKYEVIFYVFGVPALHLCARLMSARTALAVALALLAAVLTWRVHVQDTADYKLWTAHFLGGVAVAYAMAWPAARALLAGRPLHWIAALAFALLPLWPHAWDWPAVLITLLAFAAVAGGASACGLLHSRPARWLGEASYGVYLLHGLLLWTVFGALHACGRLPGLGTPAFLLLAVGLSATLVVLASVSHLVVERPAILWARRRAAR
jgi:peptidoglycan/LPS O-acetylase OafA/YrhL